MENQGEVKMKALNNKIRMIENILDNIQKPRTAAANRDGEQRGILPNAKVREAQNLSEKIFEAQKIIDRLEDPTARFVYQDALDNLETCRREIISPKILLIEEYA